MSKTRLPKQIDPLRLADRHTHLEGYLALAEMTRLASVVHSAAGDAAAVLNFGIDEQGRRYIRGQVTAEVALICQRCMQPFNYKLTSRLALSPVADEAAASTLPDNYEPLIVTGEIVALADLVEDDLILALPLVSIHEPAECAVKMISSKQEAEKANPFAVLRSLKKD